MKYSRCAACVAAALLPALACAEQPAGAADAEIDEVVVLGRSVSTGLAIIAVDREMLVHVLRRFVPEGGIALEFD